MDLLLINLIYFMVFLSAVTPHPANIEEKRIITDYNKDTSQQDELLANLQSAKYQVTENVIDIPDDRPLPEPLAHNYTFKKPLNVAAIPNIINNNNESGNTVKNDTEKNDLKRNKLSILHINADFDEQVHSNNNNSLFKGIKKYFYGIKNDIINGIHSWLHKKENTENSL